jgi:hypothetical protein
MQAYGCAFAGCTQVFGGVVKLAGKQLEQRVIDLRPEAADWPLGVDIKITKAKAAQTDSQRGLYWATLKEWGKTLGYSARESETLLHNAVLCEAYGVKETRTLYGHVIEIPRLRSSKAKRDEYSTLLETLLRLSA